MKIQAQFQADPDFALDEALLSRGRERGYLTYDEVSAAPAEAAADPQEAPAEVDKPVEHAPPVAEAGTPIRVPAAGVVGESMVALELTTVLLEQFGGDSMDQLREALEAHRRRLGEV